MGTIRTGSALVILFLFSGGCGKNISRTQGSSDPQNTKATVGLQLSGIYTDTDHQSVDLSTLRDKIQVLIFAQETCHVCSEEAFELSSYRADKGLPQVFEIRHILVGAISEDALDWKEQHRIDWSVGTTATDLFLKYCPAGQVPCLLVFKPEVGLTFQHTGKLTIEEIKKETGGWEN